MYERELDEKEEGNLPVFRGAPEVGLKNAFGWQLQGFIEDARGRLRLQTEEEHLFCMGCHSAIGVTVDSTFSFPRKVPGAGGWRTQALAACRTCPRSATPSPRCSTYLRRVGGGDEFRANDEMLARFFPDGRLDEAAVRRAARGGDRDLAWLLAPSRERALALEKVYREIVREQSFERGRDAVLAPAVNVHKKIENGDTDLAKSRPHLPRRTSLARLARSGGGPRRGRPRGARGSGCAGLHTAFITRSRVSSMLAACTRASRRGSAPPPSAPRRGWTAGSCSSRRRSRSS